MSDNYTPDMNGLLKAVQENGGIGKVDEAMKYVNNPLVKRGLQMVGIDISTIQEAYNQIKNIPISTTQPHANKQTSNVGTNTFQERLNAIRRK